MGALVAVFGTALGAWLLDRWLGVRAKVGAWRGKRKARRAALDDFIHEHMPALVRFVDSIAERDDKATQRETRITTQIQAFGEHLSRQDAVLDNIAAQLWAAARFDVQARFQCDHTGRNIAVNAAYAKLMRVSEFELGEWRWKNCLDENDAQRYIEVVQRCFREHRRFEGQAIFKRGDGTRFRGRVRLEPHPEDAADLAEGRYPTWFGSVLLIEELA